MVADKQHHNWLNFWQDPVVAFEEITPRLLAQHRVVAIAPGAAEYLEDCKLILGWKRDGLLPDTKLALVSYKGVQLWSPETDALAECWVIHTNSERDRIKSKRLIFLPLGLGKLKPGADDGYLFLGGRKMRDFHVALEAVSITGHPCIAVSDFLPAQEYAGVDMRRERIPKRDYSAIMANSKAVLVPLRQTAISHGHMDVVSAILAGKPVAVTQGASCDDYVEHDHSGVLVRDNTVECWVEAVERVWTNAQRYGEAAVEKSAEVTAERYAQNVRGLVRTMV